MSIVYLNGDYLDADEARVPVLDRGFIFGDGIYEVIPAFGGRLLRLEHHLRRLDNSLKAIRLDNPHSDDEWAELLSELTASAISELQIEPGRNVFLVIKTSSLSVMDSFFNTPS